MTTPSSPDPYRPDPAPSPGAQPTSGYPGPGFPEAGGPGSPGYPAPGAAASGYPVQPPPGPPGYAAGPPGYAPYGGQGSPVATARPGTVTAAAVLAFVVGGLGIIGNLIVFSTLSSLGVGGFYVFLSIIAIIADIGLIWGGVQVLGGKDGRIVIGAAGLLILVNLIAIIIVFSPMSLLGFILPILIIALMLGAGSKKWLDQQGATHF